MTASLKIALAQLNPTVGDVAGNLVKARKARAEAAAMGADLILFSELFIVGYPPEDLVLKPALQADARTAVEALAKETTSGPAVLIGTPWVEGGNLHNAIAYLDGGTVKALRFKVDLPNYGVFDEKRVFVPGPLLGPIDVRGVRIGVPICEDIWKGEVVECLSETGAEFLLVPNGSPFEASKEEVRLNIAVARVVESGLPLAYLNQVGGQDELVFDGASFVLNADRSLALQMPAWEEAITLTHWRRDGKRWTCEPGAKTVLPAGLDAIYNAMMLGLGDYVRKNRFPGVVLGLSGGIDSALTAAVAVDALGPERVRCVMMPSRYTSKDSLDDAAEVARLLGTQLDNIPIEAAVNAFAAMTGPLFAGRTRDTTEENIQSRIRGVTLMAISNKFGPMVITTGNKSEMSVGYATLYGDMCGGYNPLKDLYKMQVFALSKWRNQQKPKGALGPAGRVMPERVITKPPTAELRANQKDEDSLPPYAKLDDILECLVENEMPIEDIMKRGHDLATIKRVEHLLSIAEYKRRQAPPGVKITRKNFGRDRRYPITNAFRDAT
ncbi:MAG: NAD+ synthase [Alphaproteobacteria bacterium]|nr:NAD+ synthase [Alphaproteobacteria bacterium]